MFAASKTASVSGGYQISRSLRFNSADSAYLNRTPATATNRRTWTWSAWVKRSALGAIQELFDSYWANTDNGYFWVGFTSADAFEVQLYNSTLRTTTQVFRDPSAWYHLVLAIDTTQATAANRVKVYLNGSEITTFSTNNAPTQNLDTAVNYNGAHYIGTFAGSSNLFNGYMTEVNLIDGQALTPSSFGETNAQTGVWQPKAYSGSYGTNGFYVNFSDNSNTTAATLGKDYSGNGNNWTPNNFSVTAGAGNDSLVDSPTSYGTDTGVGGTVRGNYCTVNPLDKSSDVTLSNGNLDVVGTGGAWRSARTTFGMSSGKWYWEVLCNTIVMSGDRAMLGIMKSEANLGSYVGSDASGWGYYSGDGNKYTNGSASSYGNSYTTGDVIGIAFDADNGELKFYKNGTVQNSGTAAFTGLTSGPYLPAIGMYAGSVSANFGQRAFNYTAPSGFKALCTQNLPVPTIGATTATQANLYFTPNLRVGTGASGSTISTTVNMANGALLWDKSRSAVGSHYLVDSVRGISNTLSSNSTSAEASFPSWFTNFGTNSYTVGSSDWSTGITVVDWIWAANGSGSTNTAGSITSTVSANTTSGFSIVTYTGQVAAGTIGHGLGVAPSWIIVKNRTTSSVGFWTVYSSALGSTSGLFLNTTGAAFSPTDAWNSTSPTSTVFSVGPSSLSTNTNGYNFVAYCFAPISGFSAFGSYAGNGSTDGTFVYFGFRPAYVMIKASNAVDNWVIMDAARNPNNAVNYWLQAESSAAEATLTPPQFDFVSNGLKLRGTSSSCNASGTTYIYMAFASAPFKFSLGR